MINLLLIASFLLGQPEPLISDFTREALAPRGIAFLKIIAKPRLVTLAPSVLLIKFYVIDRFWGNRILQFWDDFVQFSFREGDVLTLAGIAGSVLAYYVAYHYLYKFVYGRTPYTRLEFMQRRVRHQAYWMTGVGQVYGPDPYSFLFRLGGKPPTPTLMWDQKIKTWKPFQMPKQAA